MKLSDYINYHHKGVQSHFAEFHGIPASRVNELLKSDNTAYVFEHFDGYNIVKSIFKEGRRLKSRASEEVGAKIEVCNHSGQQINYIYDGDITRIIVGENETE